MKKVMVAALSALLVLGAQAQSTSTEPKVLRYAFRSDISDQIDGLTGSGSSATITRTYADTETPAGVSVGDNVTVSVQFKIIDLHFPFVPFIHDGVVTSTGTARVDYVRNPDNPPVNC